jgi:hypothetical protein
MFLTRVCIRPLFYEYSEEASKSIRVLFGSDGYGNSRDTYGNIDFVPFHHCLCVPLALQKQDWYRRNQVVKEAASFVGSLWVLTGAESSVLPEDQRIERVPEWTEGIHDPRTSCCQSLRRV